MKDWMWLIKTSKGDFFITVIGEWTQEEAATKVRIVFNTHLKGLVITGMIPRKRAPYLRDNCCTIIEQEPPKDGLGFNLHAGKAVWQACGRDVEYEAQMVLLKKGPRE